jgi:hypothetical protein
MRKLLNEKSELWTMKLGDDRQRNIHERGIRTREREVQNLDPSFAFARRQQMLDTQLSVAPQTRCDRWINTDRELPARLPHDDFSHLQIRSEETFLHPPHEASISSLRFLTKKLQLSVGSHAPIQTMSTFRSGTEGRRPRRDRFFGRKIEHANNPFVEKEKSNPVLKTGHYRTPVNEGYKSHYEGLIDESKLGTIRQRRKNTFFGL